MYLASALLVPLASPDTSGPGDLPGHGLLHHPAVCPPGLLTAECPGHLSTSGPGTPPLGHTGGAAPLGQPPALQSHRASDGP